MTKRARWGSAAAALLLGLLALAGCATMRGGTHGGGGGDPSVSVDDQPIDGSTVTVSRAVSPGPGWIAIYTEQGGRPGFLLGYSRLGSGDNRKVIVAIDRSRATPVLYAMLHMDSGTTGRFEFPGPDAPVSIGPNVIAPTFRVLS